MNIHGHETDVYVRGLTAIGRFKYLRVIGKINFFYQVPNALYGLQGITETGIVSAYA
jgi:hypothetical protein